MNDIAVPVSLPTFLRLVDFLKAIGSDRDPVYQVEEAIDYWIDNASWKTEDLLPELVSEGTQSGYTWKIQSEGNTPSTSLFLPDTTKLRIQLKNGYEYATVQDGKIFFQSEAIGSPNKFAQQAAGHARDAWRDVWIMRPNDRNFILADELRKLARKNAVR
ncbi:hypothetical protein [Celeribacter ethanolicus]|uniref:hypothetical protein n=1 Tax=Celeribacter ethanolicus TaxID=1758178 RepID=UPI00082D5886|nr:hypothetical protein [Celeribacter ethanolicus]